VGGQMAPRCPACDAFGTDSAMTCQPRRVITTLLALEREVEPLATVLALTREVERRAGDVGNCRPAASVPWRWRRDAALELRVDRRSVMCIDGDGAPRCPLVLRL